jgi:Tn7-like transposition protein D/TniQ protein
MLGFIPDPLPDELLYSVCARYGERVQYPNKKSLLRDLFGTTTATAIIDLPCRLEYLESALPPCHRYTVDRLIDDHTLLPLFSPFLPPERVNRLREDLRGKSGPAIHRRAGITASRIHLPAQLRFCPRCTEEDRKVGEAYWHRVHQIPGVVVCPEHSVFLENSDAPIRYARNHIVFLSAEQSIKASVVRHTVLSDPDHITLHGIASNVAWLLNHPRNGSSLESLHRRYLRLLIEQGLATYSGSIHAYELLKQFKGRYSSNLLATLNCHFTGRDQTKDNWLLRLTRNPKNAQHPLRHLLFINFLSSTAESFFQLSEEIKFFGDSPWPCLNPAADHFGELTINAFRISYRGKNHKPVGTFFCECGFSYARTGPDRIEKDRFRISRMKTFGQIWEHSLRDLWQDQSICLSEIARRLKVDPLTVIRHAARLKLHGSRSSKKIRVLPPALQLKSQDASFDKDDKLRNYRSRWLSGLTQHPKLSLKSLRKKLPRVYTWLVKNDSDWLRLHRPKAKKRVKVVSGINWRKRDVKLAEMVQAARLRIKSRPGRPVRVTKTAVGKELGQLTLLRQKIHKLPLTAHTLSNIVESREDFAVRRVWWVYECAIRKNLSLKRWQVVLRAALKTDIASAPLVKCAIDNVIRLLHESNLTKAMAG